MHHFGPYYDKLRVEQKNWSPVEIQRVFQSRDQNVEICSPRASGEGAAADKLAKHI